jgi:Uncharacterized protein conserved in bacteria
MIFNRNKIIEYARKNFCSEPEYLWAKSPNYFILKHKENKKWYAIVMDIPASKLGLDDTKIIDVLNVKLDVEYEPEILNLLLGTKGFFPAYHMNKSKWISIILDDSVKKSEIINLINTSYEITK